MTTTSAISAARDVYCNGSTWTVGGTNGRAFGPVDLKYVLAVTRTHNGQNQITTISGTTNPAYDNNGNTTTDETGNTYTYDACNRLAGKSSSPGHYYQYDALGRLIREGELYWLMSDMYYNDQWQVVEDQRVQCRVGMIKSQYVWSVGFVDDMLLRDRNVDLSTSTGNYGKSSSGLEERLYALNDLNYNTSALVGLSGGTWAIRERFIEDPYGVVTVLSPTTWAPLADSNYAWAHTHQGGWWDPSSGLLHYRNRVYSPTLGRWMQQDPMGYVDGMSLYDYVRSSPQVRTDPLGLVSRHLRLPSASSVLSTAVLEEQAKHSKYQYYTIFRLDNFFSRLSQAAKSASASWGDAGGNGAQYHPLLNTVELNPDFMSFQRWRWKYTANITAIHELIHYIDDVEDFVISGPNYLLKETRWKAEGIAYASEALQQKIVGFAALDSVTTADEALTQWGKAWEKLADYVPYGKSLSDKESRPLEPYDMINLLLLFNMVTDAFDIKIAYQDFFRQKGICVNLPVSVVRNNPALQPVWYRMPSAPAL